MDNYKTLLIVDGHAGVREALTRRLRHAPAIRAVGAAGDLDQAARVVREIAPDAVLYDPHTVQGDVPLAMAQLGAMRRPVVVLTSSLLDGEEAALRRAGAADVLLKGCALSTLLGGVDTALAAQ